MVQLGKTLRRSKALHEQTYQALRECILTGALAPGDRLIETQLAEQLQVSRTPIREAIRQLQQDELVTADANGWLRVATLSAGEAMHLYDCRIALEVLAVTHACLQATNSQLQQLQQLVTQAQCWADTANIHPDYAQRLDLDCRFHRLIAEASGNGCLLSLLDQVFSRMVLLRVQTTRQNPDVLDICAEHVAIYEAIAQRDGVAATQAMQAHLVASKARVVQELNTTSIAQP